MIQDDGGELENLELYLNVKDNIETKFPELVLRPKKHIHEEEEDEAEPEMLEKEPASDVNGTEDGSMVVVIDDDEEIEVVEENGDIIEIEEPMLKKRRIE